MQKKTPKYLIQGPVNKQHDKINKHIQKSWIKVNKVSKDYGVRKEEIENLHEYNPSATECQQRV